MSYCISWDETSEQNIRYHEEEWGVPLHDDRRQFEFLMMEVMQCGLSWGLMMRKREIFRACFDGFDYDRVAAYGEEEVGRILNTEGMIRSRRKILAVINNAQRFQEIRREFGSFSEYLWAYTGGKTMLYRGHEDGWIPAANGLSEDISADLRRRGFKYIGAVTVYSHLQACGMINDHDRNCPCRRKIIAGNPCRAAEPDRERDVRYYGDA